MEVSRRSFLKRGLLLGGGAASGLAGAAAHAAGGSKKPYKLTSVNETTNICCYCSGGCGTICSTRNGELINLEGDPDHPVNLGGLCPKGAAMWGLRNIVTKDRRAQLHPDRVLYPMVRRPGSKTWERLSWDQAALEIARHVKKTRDATFVEKEGDVTVNRCDGIASLGAAQLNNEEGWLVQKFARSLGVLAIDNQTRVCHSSTVSGLAPSFGRGSMTSHWCDFANSDVIMSIGSNNVENHPLSSRWVERAQDKGATWIVVDPRYSRSAARADIYARIRPGSDLAFYGGLINYILQNDLFQKEYVLHYTNAACLLRPDFKFDVDHGLFSGWDPETKRYDNETWGYDVDHKAVWDTSEGSAFAWVNRPGTPKFKTPDLKVLKRDMTLQDPNCVLQRHEASLLPATRPTLVTRVTGMDPDVMKKVWEVFASTGRPDKAGSILYALGQTQHTYGSQNCRAMCVIQLLLGNIGIAGGGINALRGEPNVQGSTDVGASSWRIRLPPISPGRPSKAHAEASPTIFREGNVRRRATTPTSRSSWISAASSEWFGANGHGRERLLLRPAGRRSARSSTTATTPRSCSFERHARQQDQGLLLLGHESDAIPPRTASNARHSMANLDWLVVADWFQTETSTFWEAPDMKPEDVKTEVYFLPAALIYEKIGIHQQLRSVDPVALKRPSSRRDECQVPTSRSDDASLEEHRRALQEGRRRLPGSDPEDELRLLRSTASPICAPSWPGPSTATRSATASSSRATASFRLTARPLAACGSSRATGQQRVPEARPDEAADDKPLEGRPDRSRSLPRLVLRLAAPTAASSTTAAPPTRRASPGIRSACSSNGTARSGSQNDVGDFVARPRPPTTTPSS